MGLHIYHIYTIFNIFYYIIITIYNKNFIHIIFDNPIKKIYKKFYINIKKILNFFKVASLNLFMWLTIFYRQKMLFPYNRRLIKVNKD